MAKSYPSKHNSSGIWNMSDVTTAVSNNDWCSGHRAIFGGGNVNPGAVTNIMDYISVVSLGNAVDFGDLSVARKTLGAVGSFTRACFGGGLVPGGSNVIDYVTTASTGNAADFGNLSQARGYLEEQGNSSVRGIFAGGATPPTYVNTMDYITIATTGDAADFGDLTITVTEHAGVSSPTRGIGAGGYNNSPADAYVNIMDYVEITSTGNALDFGDLSSNRFSMSTAASHTRGIFHSGQVPSKTNLIEYVTMATKGNVVNFGEATTIRNNGVGSSNGKRAVFGGGGMTSPASDYQNTMDYIAIASAGNAVDFGDLSAARHALSATSNGHGGLGL